VHTKPWPLLVAWDPRTGDAASLRAALLAGVEEYAGRYRAYVQENRHEGDAEGDPFPRVILIPGVGMVTTGKDAFAARISAALYHRAVSVMQGAEACGGFISLTPNESYNVEYWPLELYKLTLAPPERDFARRIAFVTGGAGGIGRAIAERLAAEGAHVVLADLNEAGAQAVAADLCARYGEGRALAVAADVTSEDAVRQAYFRMVLAYGGVDVLVSNAGLASSAPIEETTLAAWQKNIDVLATGYFLVSREAFRVLKAQAIGGSLVYIASKNALVGGRNAAAYSAAKAAEVQLARCLAEEGGASGIRVNTVNPDAVLQGSQIWNSSWREERARNYGIAPDELEEYYRKRTTLKVNILPADIAEAVAFLASDRAAKSTGNIINVDGGVAAAYTR
jgi:rhamnulose-1-phosphate aldolase/alcohol dehydrogenase